MLNEQGKEQVRLVSNRLKDENFARVLSSDLKRTLKVIDQPELRQFYSSKTILLINPRPFGALKGLSGLAYLEFSLR